MRSTTTTSIPTRPFTRRKSALGGKATPRMPLNAHQKHLQKRLWTRLAGLRRTKNATSSCQTPQRPSGFCLRTLFRSFLMVLWQLTTSSSIASRRRSSSLCLQNKIKAAIGGRSVSSSTPGTAASTPGMELVENPTSSSPQAMMHWKDKQRCQTTAVPKCWRLERNRLPSCRQ